MKKPLNNHPREKKLRRERLIAQVKEALELLSAGGKAIKWLNGGKYGVTRTHGPAKEISLEVYNTIKGLTNAVEINSNPENPYFTEEITLKEGVVLKK